MSTYILQKDIQSPNFNIKAGAEFKQGGTPDSAFVHGNYILHPDRVIGNSEWFKLKEEPPERIEVRIYPVEQFKTTDGFYKQGVHTSKNLSQDQHEKLKKAIERVLNDEDTAIPDYYCSLRDDRLIVFTKNKTVSHVEINDKKYVPENFGWGMSIPTGPSLNSDGTPKQVKEEFRHGTMVWMSAEKYQKEKEDIFNAGRERIGGWWNNQIKNWTYPTYKDYKKFDCEKLSKITHDEPKQWEELINKPDWEIISFICKSEACKEGKAEILRVKDIPNNYTIEQYLAPASQWDIYSVCRLSDNQNFEVGKVYKDSMGRMMKPIKKFTIGAGVMYATFDEGHGNNDGSLGINSLSPEIAKPDNLQWAQDWIDRMNKLDQQLFNELLEKAKSL